MVLLQRNHAAPFTWVQDSLAVTPGNLNSHLDRLVAAGYVDRRRVLTSSGFQLTIRITGPGRVALAGYLAALHALLADGGSHPI
jgi:DNA-binding MarR family transcriptional regulator